MSFVGKRASAEFLEARSALPPAAYIVRRDGRVVLDHAAFKQTTLATQET